MSGHHEPIFSHTEEKVAAWVFFLIGLVLLAIGFLMKAGDVSLFNQEIFSARFWELFWQAFMNGWRYWVAPWFILFEIIFVGLTIWAIIGYWPIKSTVRLSQTRPIAHTRKVKFGKDPQIAHHWVTIVEKVRPGTQDAMKYAILEADALVDHFLKKAGVVGEHMAERLTQINPTEVFSVERVWEAHRLRNQLAHTPGFTVSAADTKEALEAYRDFLIELGAL